MGATNFHFKPSVYKAVKMPDHCPTKEEIAKEEDYLRQKKY